MTVTLWLSRRVAAALCLLVAHGFAGASPVHAAGALAIGTCGAYGFAYDYARADDARAAALRRCAGGKCEAVPFRRGCAALAIDGTNKCGPHGFATATKLGQAQNDALAQCYRFGGKDCVIRAFVCDAKG